MSQRHAQPTRFGRRRSFDVPAGGDGIVEPQAALEARNLIDDVCVDRGDEHDLAGAVRFDRDVDGDVEVARAEPDDAEHQEQEREAPHDGPDDGIRAITRR